MADTMQFALVSPERRLASMQVQAVLVPGADGDLTAMADHAPLITTLRPGMLRVESGEGNCSDLKPKSGEQNGSPESLRDRLLAIGNMLGGAL